MNFIRRKQDAGDVRAAGQKPTAAGASQKAPKGVLTRLIHPRIGARTAIGFGAVLVLTTIVSVVGWNSFGKFAGRVTTSDEMSQLAMNLLQARIAVKDFQILHDPKFVQDANQKLSDIQQGADQLKATLTDDADLATVDRVKAAVESYQQAFSQYAKLQTAKEEALEAMQQVSAAAKTLAGDIGTGQKQASSVLQDQIVRMGLRRDDKMKAAEEAGRLLTWIAEIRRNEKDLLLSGEQEYADAVKDLTLKIISGPWRFDNTDALDQILLAVTNYQVAFEQLLEILAGATNSKNKQVELLHSMAGNVKTINTVLPDLEDALASETSQAEALADIKMLIQLLADARLAEKDFILKPTPNSAEVITKSAEAITKYSAGLPARFASPVFIEMAGQMTKAIKAYAAGFKELSEVRYAAEGFILKKKISIDEMVRTADNAEELIIALRDEQEEHYVAAAKDLKAMQFTSLLKLQLAEDAGTIVKMVSDAREAEKAYLLKPNEDAIMAVSGSMGLVSTLADDMKAQLQQEDEKQLIGDLQKKADAYQDQFLKVVDLTMEQADANNKMVEAAATVNQVVDGARHGQHVAMEQEKALADEVNLWGTAVALLLGILLAYVIGRGVSRPVNEMTRAMRRLADGDLEVEVPARGRHDEIGEMAATVQVFKDSAIDKIRMEKEQEEREKRAEEEKRAAMIKLADQFETSVGEVVEQVSSAAAEMKSSSESMSATAEETTHQSAAVAAASEQASANVQTVASAAEELSSSISEIARQVGQASEIASGAVRQAEQTNAKIQGLAEAANKIGEVVALITDIADQTNLLALNATIEAARAGDAGKGFAVVASEVKNLANQTAKATDEIGTQIADIQSATKDAVDAIIAITRTISEINEVNSGIASAVEQQGAATQEIARNVEQAASGTHEVTSNITGVSQAANDTGAAAAQIQGAASELSQQSEKLRAEVDKFLSTVRAA